MATSISTRLFFGDVQFVEADVVFQVIRISSRTDATLINLVPKIEFKPRI